MKQSLRRAVLLGLTVALLHGIVAPAAVAEGADRTLAVPGPPPIAVTATTTDEPPVAVGVRPEVEAPGASDDGRFGQHSTSYLIDYTGSPPAAVQAAVEFAAQRWTALLGSQVPLHLNVGWESLGGNYLGDARSSQEYLNFRGAPRQGVLYPAALANHLAGGDLDTSLPDVYLRLNSDFGSWYMGLDGQVPSMAYDMVSVALHEIGHGIGFGGSAKVASGTGEIGLVGGGVRYPRVYDLLVQDATGDPLYGSAYANPSTALGQALTSGSLRIGLPVNRAGNRIYSPALWTSGSSFSHFDEVIYPRGDDDSLMTPSLTNGEAVHQLGLLGLAVLHEVGWPACDPARGDLDGDAVGDVCDAIADLANDHAFYPFARALVEAHVSTGCSPAGQPFRFCPDVPVTRGDMAIFLARAAEGGDTADALPAYAGGFDDVAEADYYSRYVRYLSDQSVTSGCGGGNYCPVRSVRRGDMTLFLSRTHLGRPNADALPAYEGGFDDVSAADYYSSGVRWAKDSMVTAGCGTGTTFCPSDSVTRGQMAVFLTRTFGLPIPQ